MTADQIRSLQPALAALLERFRPFFARQTTFKHWHRYLAGLLADLKRKSIEPIALAAGIPVRTLQEFLAFFVWDEDRIGNASVVINESALRALGFSRPADAIGKTLRADIFGSGTFDLEIIGVSQDVFFRSIKFGIRPSVFFNNPDMLRVATISFETSVLILVTSALPPLTDVSGGVTINGELSVLDGGALIGGENGIEINSAGNVIDGLMIINFPGSGIEIAGIAANDNLIGALGGNAIGNFITDNGAYGIKITGPEPARNQIRGNSIFANGDVGIFIPDGGNQGIAAPVITAIEPVRGTVEPNATIEIFIGPDEEGESIFETVIADAAGNFTGTLSLDLFVPFLPVNVTATATDAAGNTSEFSAPFAVPATLPPFE